MKDDRGTKVVRAILGTVLLMGLVHCGTRTAASRDVTESAPRARAGLELDASVCPDGSAIATLDTITALPDGDAGTSATCVTAGGAVRFASECTTGPVVFSATTAEGVFTKIENSCFDLPMARVSVEGNAYTFPLLAPHHWCQLGISSDAGDQKIAWELLESPCRVFSKPHGETIIRGTIDVVPTRPTGPPDAGR